MDSVMCRGFCKETQNPRHITTPLLAALWAQPMNIDEILELLKSKNEPVPKPFRLPTAIEVGQAERDLNFKFPEQYRQFMLEASNVHYNVLEPGLVIPDLMPYISLRHMASMGWSHGIPKNHLPFCEDNGNYFTISTEGNIGYYDHDDNSHNFGSSKFKDWIEEEWMFDYD
jgi:hypothetical protein